MSIDEAVTLLRQRIGDNLPLSAAERLMLVDCLLRAKTEQRWVIVCDAGWLGIIPGDEYRDPYIGWTKNKAQATVFAHMPEADEWAGLNTKVKPRVVPVFYLPPRRGSFYDRW